VSGHRAMHGYGLRLPHYDQLIERGPGCELVEAVTENFAGRGGRARAVLERVRRDAEVALHGVSLSLGSVDPLSERYLEQLDALQRHVQPLFVSDHLCFGTVFGHYSHDLWPLPYTEEAIAHVVTRIAVVQERLRRQILIENVSSYIEHQDSTLSEHAFLAEVAERADCLILLDVNNVVVSAKNHGFDPLEYIATVPVERVAQLHLAGHSDYGTHAIDDHGSAMPQEVWALYEAVIARFGDVPAIVEWDQNIPTLDELQAHSAVAREFARARMQACT